MKYIANIFLLLFLLGCQINPNFDANNAFNHLEKQCEIGPRNPNSPEIEICREYIINSLENVEADVSKQEFTAMVNDSLYYGANIVAQFYPRQSRRILLAAHYDTRPWADKEPDPKLHNTPILGANDAASGVAILLELASIINENQPEAFGIDMVFFDMEDMGEYSKNDNWCLGSKYFAANLPIRVPEKAIIVDMIGDKDLNIEMEYFSYHDSPILVNEVWEIAQELGYSQFKRKVGKHIYDDHVPLLEVGINAIDIIDLDYPYWHTLQDTPDKCSPESLEAVGQTLIELIYQK